MTQVRARALFGCAALLIYLGFFSLGELNGGMEVAFKPPWNRMLAGELTFWLSSVFFLLPVGVLAGLALEPTLRPALGRLHRWVEGLSHREWLQFVVLISALALIVIWSGNQVVLLGYPITDDENAARFGGQVLASGRLMAPMPAMQEFFPHLFIVAQGGAWTAADFLGSQLAWAFGELTRTGAWIFHVLALVPIPSLMILMAKRYGPGWGLCAGVLFFFSPMAFTLSLTTHAHVLSRAFLAVAIACFYLPPDEMGWPSRILGSLALTLAMLCRPIEVLALTLPFLFIVIVPESFRDRGSKGTLAAVLAGMLLALVVILVHNYGLSGDPFIGARLMENDFTHPYGGHFDPVWSPHRFWERFGGNVSYNALVLSIWFLGVPGVILAAIGATVDRRTAALGLGILVALLTGMLHDDFGLHIVGPIHYSETAVPLTVLAIEGLRQACLWLRKKGFAPSRMLAVLAVMLPVSFGTFTLWQARFLHDQASIHLATYGMVEDVPERPAVVLVPRYSAVWHATPEFRRRGTYVFEWRRPHPGLSEEILLVHDEPGALEAVRGTFPERALYRLAPHGRTPQRIATP
jgi:hypothetical protein